MLFVRAACLIQLVYIQHEFGISLTPVQVAILWSVFTTLHGMFSLWTTGWLGPLASDRLGRKPAAYLIGGLFVAAAASGLAVSKPLDCFPLMFFCML